MATNKKPAVKPAKKPATQASKKPEKAAKSEAAPVDQVAGDFHGRKHD